MSEPTDLCDRCDFTRLDHECRDVEGLCREFRPNEKEAAAKRAAANGRDYTFAFPSVAMPNGDFLYGANGLTKREHFAALAMQGLIAARYSMIESDLSLLSVKHADELLAALERVKP